MQEPVRKKLRVGLIGCGWIAPAFAERLLKMDDVELAAATSTNAAKLDGFGAKYGIPSLFTDWKKMLAHSALDAVFVLTPNNLHLQPTLDALHSGAHVLVEKPLAFSAAEGERMLAAARECGKLLVIGFQYRFDPRSRILRKAVADGFFGKILFVRVQALRRRGIPNWGVYGRKELQGGGPLLDIGCHVLEMAHYVMGCPEPQAATGNLWTFMGDKPPSTDWCWWPKWDHKTYTVEDFAIGSIRMKNGAMIHIEASYAAHIEKDIFSFTLCGEKGGAQWEPFGLFYDQQGMMLNATPHYVPKEDVQLLKIRDFVDACRLGQKSTAPAEDGLTVQRMLEGIYASAAAGREVELK